jgi:hypothetical protein
MRLATLLDDEEARAEQGSDRIIDCLMADDISLMPVFPPSPRLRPFSDIQRFDDLPFLLPKGDTTTSRPTALPHTRSRLLQHDRHVDGPFLDRRQGEDIQMAQRDGAAKDGVKAGRSGRSHPSHFRRQARYCLQCHTRP